MIAASFYLQCSFLAGAVPSVEAERSAVLPPGEYDSEVLFQHLMRIAEVQFAAAARERAALTAESWPQRRAALRARIMEMIGPFPERTPLNPRRVGQVEREGYTIEKIVFESRPGFYVTANLYLPAARSGRRPGILFPCGHSSNGKAEGRYQQACQGLVKKGYVVLIYDPLGQGERSQYLDRATGENTLPVGTTQHCYDGIRLELIGYNLANFRIWDGIRALDYLCSRPEVDPTRIGVTGNSGGGTLTTYIAALDDRVRAAVPGCYITTFRHRFLSRVPADPEQNFLPIVKYGIDHVDLLSLRAPDPVMVASAVRDFFPIEGARETYRLLREIYRKLGVEERVGMVEADEPHGFSQPLREGMYGWFNRWLGQPGEAAEPPVEIEPDEVLQVTPRGQVLLDLGGVTVHEQTLALAEAVRPAPPDLSTAEAVRAHQARLRAALRQVLGWEENEGLAVVPLHPRTVGQLEGDGYVVEKVVFESEPGLPVPGLLFRPRRGVTGRAMVSVDEFGKATETVADGPVVALARSGNLVFSIDVRGVGETRSAVGQDDYYQIYGTETDLNFISWMIGRPLLGMRVWDVLSAASYLRARPEAAGRPLGVRGEGLGGLLALLAAALEESIAEVETEAMLVSYRALLETPVPRFHPNVYLPRVLRFFDLPEVAAAVAPRPLTLRGTVDAVRRPLPVEQVRALYRRAAEAYERLGVPEALKIR